jgi:hypothetical protein
MVLTLPGGEEIIPRQKDVRETSVDSESLAQVRTKWWSMPGLACLPENDSGDYTRDYATGAMQVDNTDDQCFYIGVRLPHGAVIKTVEVVADNHAADANWIFYRATKAGGSRVTLAADDLDGDQTAQAVSSNATVDNENYIYYFLLDLIDATKKIYGFVISYELDDPWA